LSPPFKKFSVLKREMNDIGSIVLIEALRVMTSEQRGTFERAVREKIGDQGNQYLSSFFAKTESDKLDQMTDGQILSEILKGLIMNLSGNDVVVLGEKYTAYGGYDKQLIYDPTGSVEGYLQILADVWAYVIPGAMYGQQQWIYATFKERGFNFLKRIREMGEPRTSPQMSPRMSPQMSPRMSPQMSAPGQSIRQPTSLQMSPRTSPTMSPRSPQHVTDREHTNMTDYF